MESPDYIALDQRLIHQENQVNAMNLALARQGLEMADLKDMVKTLAHRVRSLEAALADLQGEGGAPVLSDLPPDGVNR